MLYDAASKKHNHCMHIQIYDAKTHEEIEQVYEADPEEGWFAQYYHDGKPQVVIKDKEGNVYKRTVKDTPFYLKNMVTGEIIYT